MYKYPCYKRHRIDGAAFLRSLKTEHGCETVEHENRSGSDREVFGRKPDS